MPTYYYVQNQGKLIMQSRENDQKFQFRQICETKNKKNCYGRFWEKYQSVWFSASLETFSRISPNQVFFSKILLGHFSTFIVP